MQPVSHVVLSTTAALLWKRYRGRFPWAWWLASILMDADHYLWYGTHTGRWDIREAWYGSRDEELRQKHGHMPLHRWPLLLGLVVAGRKVPLIKDIAWGLAFHKGLDEISRRWPKVAYSYRRWRYERMWSLVAKRAGYRCEHCGTGKSRLELHHRVPEFLGGRFEPDNLVLLCQDCHDRAHARPPRRPLEKEACLD